MMSQKRLDNDRSGRDSWTSLEKTAIGTAIVQTLAYADIFDYPLTAQEIHQYLIGTATSQEAVQSALDNGGLVPGCLSHVQEFFTLSGRESIVNTRLRRAKVATRMWPRAREYGATMASLPFVRMVAVTGALAMHNVDSDDDFDFFIVTQPGRLWLCRAMIIALVVRPAARRGDEVCPNYLLSERALVLPERNLFTAHELAQMMPIAGWDVYQRLRALNPWVDSFLPNACAPVQPALAVPPRPGGAQALVESILRTPLGAGLERWEMGRKVRKLNRQNAGRTETAFSPDWCKGHFDSHGQHILLGYSRRLDEIEC